MSHTTGAHKSTDFAANKKYGRKKKQVHPTGRCGKEETANYGQLLDIQYFTFYFVWQTKTICTYLVNRHWWARSAQIPEWANHREMLFLLSNKITKMKWTHALLLWIWMLSNKCSFSNFSQFQTQQSLYCFKHTQTQTTTRPFYRSILLAFASRSLSIRTRTWLMRCEESAFVLS